MYGIFNLIRVPSVRALKGPLRLLCFSTVREETPHFSKGWKRLPIRHHQQVAPYTYNCTLFAKKIFFCNYLYAGVVLSLGITASFRELYGTNSPPPAGLTGLLGVACHDQLRHHHCSGGWPGSVTGLFPPSLTSGPDEDPREMLDSMKEL